MTYPNIEVQVLVCDRLNIETDRWDRCDHLAYLHRVSARVSLWREVEA